MDVNWRIIGGICISSAVAALVALSTREERRSVPIPMQAQSATEPPLPPGLIPELAEIPDPASGIRFTSPLESFRLTESERIELERRVARGDGAAAVRLAYFHGQWGIFTGRDPAEAGREELRWMRIAAELGDAPAQANMALYLLEGSHEKYGLMRDLVEAEKWLNKAEATYRAKGDSEGLYFMGLRRETLEAAKQRKARGE